MDGVSSAVRAERLECGVLRVRDLNRPKRIRCALRAGQTAPIGIDNPVIGRRSGAVLELTHTLCTAVSLLRCCTHAELRGRELCGTITSGRSRIRFRWEKQTERTEG